MALFSLYVLFITLLTRSCIIFSDVCALVDDEEQATEQRNTRVEIRPVLINCRLEADGERSRFERQELLKHNALHDGDKKLVMAINLLSEPDDAVVDEYIPVEHVFETNSKRLRLLNPYVLRVRRQPTYETYSIQKVNTVAVVVMDSFERGSLENEKSKRDLHEKEQVMNFNVNYHRDAQHIGPTGTDNTIYGADIENSKMQNNAFTKFAVNSYYGKAIRDRREMKVYDETMMRRINNLDGRYTTPSYVRSTKVLKEPAQVFANRNIEFSMSNYDLNPFDKHNSIFQKEYSGIDLEVQAQKDLPKESITESLNNVLRDFDSKVKEFELYEIDDDPSLLFSSRVQLFEKINTPDGETAWNDMTKDDTASVGTSSREWSNGDFNIRYKSGDWMPRESFALPQRKLCLVIPSGHNNKRSSDYDFATDFLIVPQEDIINIENNNMNSENKDSEEKQQNYSHDALDTDEFQAYPRVGIRVSKALTSDDLKGVKIITRATNPHIELPYRRTHRAQIDLEAVADDNDVILVGYSGSLITIVSDTKRSRAILDVQAKNTGLAAARFKVAIRECRPEVLSSINSNSEGIVSESEDVPPYHTQLFRLQIPYMDQIDNARCVVALVNNDDESIAVREVRLKRDDRCYCIWQCDCVCIGEDPQLMCQIMSRSQSAAAGLPSSQNDRYARSVCYPNVVPLNFFVSMLGVFLTLIFLGLIKASLGLFCRCVGSWGLHFILQTPRKLDHYHESSLRNISVEYDDEGWPIHPDTKQRTVRLISKTMEYVLNITFFVILPCIIFWNTLRNIICGCQKKDLLNYTHKNDVKKCFSSDVQSGQRRFYRHRASLRRWMSPQAETLTKNIWNDDNQDCTKPTMRSLKNVSSVRESDDAQILDSEQDDTEYVLMEMQKSRVSLDKNQRKLSNKES